MENQSIETETSSSTEVDYASIQTPLHHPWVRFWKRFFDILISLIFLCTLYPFVYLFVWLGNKITKSKGPIYFRQKRTGLNGKDFLIYKFRSMIENDQADLVQASKDDPRITKFGHWLRFSSFDELPQFINVLKGDMTLIGPRTHMLYHTETYKKLIPNYMLRHCVKPGITGWAQVNGLTGETKHLDDMKKRVKYDLWYIQHWSFALDVKIFFKTSFMFICNKDRGAY